MQQALQNNTIRKITKKTHIYTTMHWAWTLMLVCYHHTSLNFLTVPVVLCVLLKVEQGVIQFYFRKIPHINKNFWWIQLFLIRCGWRDVWKKVQNETTKRFLVGNTKINILTYQG